MRKTLIVNDKIIILLKCLLFISIPFLNLFILRNTEFNVMILSLILSFAASLFITKYLFKNIFNNIKKIPAICSLLLSNYIINIYYNYHFLEPFKNNYYQFSKVNLIILSVFSIFALSQIIYFLTLKLKPIIKEFITSLTNSEKKLILFITIGGFLITTVIYNITSVFYYVPEINWDLIYTSDSSAIFLWDTYFNINSPINDFSKQPLFGLFALPFAVCAKIFSQIFFMIPNGYAIFLTVVQLFALSLTLIMLKRLFDFRNKWGFVFLFICSFSVISFVLIMEQYLLSLFYLVLIFYVYYNNKGVTNYAYIAGTGALITTGLTLPFISNDKRHWIKNFFKCLLAGILIIIVFGQIPVIFNFVTGLVNNINSFGGGDLGFSERIMQFLNFIKGIFIAIPAAILPTIAAGPEHLSYYLEPVYHYSKIGILILILSIISVIINRKNKMAIISFVWIIFSIILLAVFGYGSQENGLNLYSLYFSWAYIGLIYLLIDKIPNKYIKNSLIIVLIIIFLYFNIPEFINIIKFGIKYYPV